MLKVHVETPTVINNAHIHPNDQIGKTCYVKRDRVKKPICLISVTLFEEEVGIQFPFIIIQSSLLYIFRIKSEI